MNDAQALRKKAVFGAAFGMAAALTLIVAGGFIYWLSHRPKGMDATAIRAMTSSATQTFVEDDAKRDLTPSGFQLIFVLANTTGRDYTLPADVKLFKRDGRTGALSELDGKPRHSFLIPAKDRAEVWIDIEYSCADLNMETGVTTQRDSQTCYNDAVGSVSGFLALDYSNHIRIDLPKPSLMPTPANPPVQVSK